LRFANYADNTIKNYAAQVELFLRYFNSQATKPSEISKKENQRLADACQNYQQHETPDFGCETILNFELS